MVTGQLSIANTEAHVLFDSGATHSFASHAFAKKLDRFKDRIRQTFSTTLSSGKIMLSNYWLRHIPITIVGRQLYVDLVILDMFDYNVILGMDFLRRYNATIACQERKVSFRPEGMKDFEYVDDFRETPRMMITTM